MRTSLRHSLVALAAVALLAASAAAHAAPMSVTGNGAGTKSFTSRQVAKHSTPSDCWVIVLRGVYNVSRQAQMAGPMGLFFTPLCGTDATLPYVSRLGQDMSLLERSKVGVLKGKGTVLKPLPPGTYMLTDVAKHGGFENCWTTVGMNVYDLTALIAKDDAALAAADQSCGGVGTAAFTALYGASTADILAPYKIGVLAG